MTTILAPMPGSSSDVPTFASSDARSSGDSNSNFGPALSEARERMDAPDNRRFQQASDRAERSEAATQRERPASTERPDRSAAERADDADRNDAEGDTAGDAADAPVRDERAESSSDETADEATMATPVTPTTEPHGVSTDIAAAMVATVLPTAKGAAGDGGPSTEPTVEGAASPSIVSTDDAGVDAPVFDDGVTIADLEAMTATAAEAAEADVADMGRQAALTSLEQVNDTNLELASRIQPAPTEEVEAPAALGDTDLTEATASTDGEIVLQGETADADTGRAEDVEVPSTPEDVDDADPTLTPDDAEVATQPVQKASVPTLATTEAGDNVVVLAREAAAVSDVTKPSATTAAPTAGPLQTAEANLWEDVRAAFDRIRSTGDTQEVRIRLRPAELGELLVQVRTQGEHVAVRLVASSAAAQQTLIDDRLRLAAELARAGFDEGSVDISQQNASDSGQRGGDSGDGDADQPGQSLPTGVNLDRVGTREIFERREPIRTEASFRPGRTATSTISLTL